MCTELHRAVFGYVVGLTLYRGLCPDAWNDPTTLHDVHDDFAYCCFIVCCGQKRANKREENLWVGHMSQFGSFVNKYVSLLSKF